jgi:hypothetical protein
MLRNERYRGVQVWNRTEKIRNPETGRKVSKARPKEDWKRVDVPEWRIVPEELWNAVQSRIQHISRTFGASRLGGMSRTENARSYLFSGLLKCGQCGSRMVIISGQAKRGYAKYGCPSHRYRGVCRNGLTIRRDRLEEQLLAALEQRILNAQLIEYILQRFQDELQKRLLEIQNQANELDDLRQQRRELQTKAERMADAIADAGHSPTMLAKLAAVEEQIAAVDRLLEARKPIDLSTTVGEIREFVSRNVFQLKELLRGDASRFVSVRATHLEWQGQMLVI